MRMSSAILAVMAAVIGLPVAALADRPRNWQMGFQEPATPVMEQITEFHDLLLVIIIGISLFVLLLLFYVMVRFRESKNPNPSKTTHHSVLEVVWTVVPVMILVVIAIPSFKLLYFEDVVPDADMTLNVTGHQWYWTYRYPDHDDVVFDAFLVRNEDLEEGQVPLLTTDATVVLPTDTTVRVLVTADDVIHAWAVPAFGVKIDAVPGRINETWVRITRAGTYYGMCSELCGKDHGFMPIMVEAVPKPEFDAWISQQQAKQNRTPEASTRFAEAPLN